MDRSQFDIIGFDRGGLSTTIKPRVLYAQEIFAASIGFGSTKEKNVSIFCSFKSSVVVGNAKKRTMSTLTRMLCSTTLMLIAYRNSMYDNVLNSSFILNYIKYSDKSFSEQLSVNFKLNYVRNAVKLFADIMNVNFRLNTNKNVPVVGIGLLNGFFDIASFVERTISLSVEIKPGSRLLIDTDNYLVLLDGENIIHLLNGDLQRLKPENIHIAVDIGTGSIAGQMLYVPKYL